MAHDRKKWMASYRKYEEACNRAAMLPPGKRRDAAYAKAQRQHDELMADPDRPKMDSPTPVESAWVNLLAVYMLTEQEGYERDAWSDWTSDPDNEPPKTKSEALSDAAKEWLRAKKRERKDRWLPSSVLRESYRVHKDGEPDSPPDKKYLDNLLSGRCEPAYPGIGEEHREKRGRTWFFHSAAFHEWIKEHKPQWQRMDDA